MTENPSPTPHSNGVADLLLQVEKIPFPVRSSRSYDAMARYEGRCLSELELLDKTIRDT